MNTKTNEVLGIEILAWVMFMSTNFSCYSDLLLDPVISVCILESCTGLDVVLKHSTGSECTHSSPF